MKSCEVSTNNAPERSPGRGVFSSQREANLFECFSAAVFDENQAFSGALIGSRASSGKKARGFFLFEHSGSTWNGKRTEFLNSNDKSNGNQSFPRQPKQSACLPTFFWTDLDCLNSFL